MLATSPTCDACPVARWRHVETGAVVECVCGATYPAPERPAMLPSPPPAEVVASSRRPSRPGAAPDARVSVVHDPQPSSAPRFSRPAFSDDQVARVVRFLEELQTDRDDDRAGGVSWAPPSTVAAQRYDREVVQTSVREPGVPNLAALLDAVDEQRPTVGARIDRFRSDPGGPAGELVASVLWWLRENGDRGALERTPRAELTRIYDEVGYLYASMKARARYDADPRVRAEAAPVLGRTLVQQAMDAWWA